jgi:hypothetical protein
LSRNGNDLVPDDVSGVDLQASEGVVGSPATLGRRPRIEQTLCADAQLVDRLMAMTEDDERGIREPALNTGGATGRGSGVVDHPDTDAVEIQCERLGEDADECGVVVAEHGVDRREPGELVEQVARQHVTGVQDHVRALQLVVHGVR